MKPTSFQPGWNRSHGAWNTPEYRAWLSMKTRCGNPKIDSARWYVGVKIHPEWERSFEAFFRDMGKRPSSKHSLDRWPDKHGNYEPGNCRWATQTQQIRNRRDNIILTIDEASLLLVEWSELTGVKYHTIRNRLKAGWSEKDAVFTPAKKRSK